MGRPRESGLSRRAPFGGHLRFWNGPQLLDQAAAFVAFGEDSEDELRGAFGQREPAQFDERRYRRNASPPVGLLERQLYV